MATFLELVKDLARESGSMDQLAITSVVDQVGRVDKMVGWVRRAYNNIQNSRRDWGWLVSEFTAPLIVGNARYAPASFGITRFASWDVDRDWYMPLSIYDAALGLSDEHELPQVSYEYWRSRYGRNDQTSGYQHRPTEYARSPNNELVFGSLPDKAYMVRGQYQKGPQTLTANNDIPEMPVRFHDLILWEAMRLLQIADGAYNESSFPAMEATRLRHDLEVDQLPEVMIP